MKIIPLQGGASNAHQQITTQLGENLVQLVFNYQQTGQWSMNLTIDGEASPLCAGAMLEPACDILESWNVSETIGALVLNGEPTTLVNLGVENQLVWVAPDEL